MSNGAVRGWDELALLIDGELVPGAGAEMVVVDPASETVCARIRGADPGQVEEAVLAARRAFDAGSWTGLPAAARSEAMHRLADGLEKRVDGLVEAVVTEAGSPVSLARSLQVGVPTEHLRYYADACLTNWTEDMGPHGYVVASHSVVAYRPVGVVAAISAYNYPLVIAMHKLGAALAAGCSVVLVPSPRTPVATLILAEAVYDAGLPPGVVNVVAGGSEVARQVTERPEVDKIAFTGSPEVGTLVMRQAATGLRGVVLELGGKSPALLLPDADLESVVPELHQRYSRNAGQGCASPTRLLVPAEHWDDFIDLSRAAYRAIKVGDPWDPDTVVGPLISSEHRDRVESYISEALSAGGQLAAGGGRPDLARGWYTNPALVVGAENSWRIAREEIFGPVAVAFPYSTVDEAIAIANDTDYGLHAYMFTSDPDLGVEISARLRAGTVSINGGGGLRPDAPMGGFGISGIGRELGRWGIHEYLEPQHIQWRLSGTLPPGGRRG